MSKKDQPKAGIYGWIFIWVIKLGTAPLFKKDWRNRQNMPRRGPVIIAVNHVSHIDTVLVARMVWDSGRLPRFMAKSTIFDVPAVGFFMRATDQIPVYRNSTAAASSLDDAAASLRRGESVIIYPEGTTTKDPQRWPMHAKTGMARLILQMPEVPVVPVAQWGAQPREKNVKRRRATISAIIGEPLDMSHWAGAAPTADNLDAISDEIMSVIRRNLGELRGQTPPAEVFRLPGMTSPGMTSQDMTSRGGTLGSNPAQETSDR